MTFERVTLVVILGCVAGLFTAVLIRPLSEETATPRAYLALPAGALVAQRPVVQKPTAAAPAATGSARGALAQGAHRQPAYRSSYLSSRHLTETFDRLGYSLTTVAAGHDDVPRLVLAKLPSDLDRVPENRDRRQIFFQAVLPLVLQINEEIAHDRQRLWKLHFDAGVATPLEAADRAWLDAMADRYDTAKGDIAALLQRVDVVPPSLALAQAAEESGWGTSRFAREGNALFGQWTYSGSNGMVPGAAAPSDSHRVRSFASLTEAARAYAFNLNTHRAYAGFRKARAAMRQKGLPLDGLTLTHTLGAYSERKTDYIVTIRSIIQSNGLSRLDDARLRDGQPLVIGKPV